MISIEHFSNLGDQTHIGTRKLGIEPVFHSYITIRPPSHPALMFQRDSR